jgi:prepilin-type processing-associated H-X9-DG protein/prepilin-type N-terminal cleavage/methylation domain-containing protein
MKVQEHNRLKVGSTPLEGRAKRKHPHKSGLLLTGFTLIELLVAISIIALLMGILMPMLGRARESARSTICMGNVRRISMAGYIYALEGDGDFPPYRMRKVKPTDPDGYVNGYGRKNPRWQWFFDHGIGPVINPAPHLESINSKGYFDDSDTLIMTNDYFMCPSFNHPGFDKRDIRNGSYGYNYQYLGNPRLTADGGHFQNFPVYIVNIQRPSETVIIADSRGGRGQTGPPDIPHGLHSYTLDPPKIARSKGATEFGFTDTGPVIEQQHSPAEARHSTKANVSFVDGHAEHLSLKDLGYVLDSGGSVIADHPEGSNHLWSGTGRSER